jgi:outer membrane protein OmpA-like peptidoglycan-associated protein
MRTSRRWLAFTLAVLASTLLIACATPPQATTTAELPFDKAVPQVIDDLFNQTQGGFVAQMESKLAHPVVLIDPLLDGGSGQQTAVTRTIEKRIADRVHGNYPQFDIQPFQPGNLTKASLLLTGTLTRDSGPGSDPRRMRLALSLTDLKSGKVVAQATARTRDDGLDTKPTPFYQDSPVLVRDKVVDGYIRTAETPPGQPADRGYIEKVATATLIEEATNSYNNEAYAEALKLYKAALAAPGGDQLRVHTGIYLSDLKLGKAADAEVAFGQIVASGLASNNLGVKFLFKPGSTDFWTDPKISGPYVIWLRQIARQSSAAKVCMNIVGHTSRTGSEQSNDRLSQQRAATIRQRLEAEAPDLGARIKATGQGFRQTIVGTGTDDARDALDRRVEFKIVNCPI